MYMRLSRAHARAPLITFRAASADVTALMIITVMVFIYPQRWKKGSGGGIEGGAWMDAVWSESQSRQRGGKGGGSRWRRRAEDEDSIVHCAQTSESLSWCVYMSPSTRDMQNVVADGGWRISWSLSCFFPSCFYAEKEHYGKVWSTGRPKWMTLTELAVMLFFLPLLAIARTVQCHLNATVFQLLAKHTCSKNMLSWCHMWLFVLCVLIVLPISSSSFRVLACWSVSDWWQSMPSGFKYKFLISPIRTAQKTSHKHDNNLQLGRWEWFTDALQRTSNNLASDLLYNHLACDWLYNDTAATSISCYNVAFFASCT